MGGCQNYGPFLGALNSWCRIILRTPKRDPILENYPYGMDLKDPQLTHVSLTPSLNSSSLNNQFGFGKPGSFVGLQGTLNTVLIARSVRKVHG